MQLDQERSHQPENLCGPLTLPIALVRLLGADRDRRTPETGSHTRQCPDGGRDDCRVQAALSRGSSCTRRSQTTPAEPDRPYLNGRRAGARHRHGRRVSCALAHQLRPRSAVLISSPTWRVSTRGAGAGA